MKNNIKKLLLLLTTVLMLSFAFSSKGFAGFGDFNDYDYDSGSDWGSDWDSDWDSDYDSDWGYDWGSSTYSSDSGSSSSGDSFPDGWAFIITAIIIIVLVAPSIYKSNKGNSSARPVQRATSVKTLPERNNVISEVIKKHDPDFSANDFLSFARQVYLDIQDAWMKRDLTPVRTVLHQNLYQQTEKQIEQKKAQGIINYLERISVNTAYLTSYTKDSEYEFLSVYMAASMIDYQVKEATGQILYGDKTTRWNMYYKMTFTRSLKSKTRSADSKDTGWVCPNCGAPLTGTSFGVCEYCGSPVTTGIYDWVLSSFGVVKPDTVDEGVATD